MNTLNSLLETAGFAMEAAGVGIIVVGAAIATVVFLLQLRSRGVTHSYTNYRVGLARSILLGLELLVAGDIIRTVIVSPTLGSVGVLAVIVLIRTFLSFTLELEVTGRLPWQRAGGGEPDQRQV